MILRSCVQAAGEGGRQVAKGVLVNNHTATPTPGKRRRAPGRLVQRVQCAACLRKPLTSNPASLLQTTATSRRSLRAPTSRSAARSTTSLIWDVSGGVDVGFRGFQLGGCGRLGRDCQVESTAAGSGTLETDGGDCRSCQTPKAQFASKVQGQAHLKQLDGQLRILVGAQSLQGLDAGWQGGWGRQGWVGEEPSLAPLVHGQSAGGSAVLPAPDEDAPRRRCANGGRYGERIDQRAAGLQRLLCGTLPPPPSSPRAAGRCGRPQTPRWRGCPRTRRRRRRAPAAALPRKFRSAGRGPCDGVV